jgi:hypothetical protein
MTGTIRQLPKGESLMPDHATCHSLLDAVERYFDLMFDSDVSRFEGVFASSAPTARLARRQFASVARA